MNTNEDIGRIVEMEKRLGTEVHPIGARVRIKPDWSWQYGPQKTYWTGKEGIITEYHYRETRAPSGHWNGGHVLMAYVDLDGEDGGPLCFDMVQLERLANP